MIIIICRCRIKIMKISTKPIIYSLSKGNKNRFDISSSLDVILYGYASPIWLAYLEFRNTCFLILCKCINNIIQTLEHNILSIFRSRIETNDSLIF